MEATILSRSEVQFKFCNNQQSKLYTTKNTDKLVWSVKLLYNYVRNLYTKTILDESSSSL